MSITLDSAPSTRQLASSASSLTYSFTRAAGNGVLFVSVAVTDSLSISGVTYGGQAMTLVASSGPSAAGVTLYQFRLRNPSSSGANNVVATASGTAAFILATTISFSGDSDSGAVNTNTATGTGTSLNNSLSVSDQSWCVLSAGADAHDVTAGTGTTATTTANPLSGYNGPRSGAGTTSMSVSSSVSDSIRSIITEVKDSAPSNSLNVTQTAIDPHTAGIVLNLTGTGTSWTGGTTFTVSGVSGTSKTSQSVTNSTTATVTVTTGTTAGTLTVSDGTLSDTVTVSTYKTVDVTTGGVNLRVLEPASYDGSTATGLVLYHMGRGEDRTAWTTDALKLGILTQLISDGRLLAAVSAGSTSWGNDASLATYAVAHPYILANWNVSGVVLMPQSMGSGTGFRCAHDQTTYQRIKGVYSIYAAACDVLAAYDDNASFQAEILTAWGAANRAALVTALSGKNPTGLSAAGYAGLRYYFHASAADTVAVKAHQTDPMRVILATVTTFDNGIVTTSGDHGDTTNFDPANASAFVTAALAQSAGGGGRLINGGLVA